MRFLFGWSIFFCGFTASEIISGAAKGDAVSVAFMAAVLGFHVMGAMWSLHHIRTRPTEGGSDADTRC